MDVLKRPWILDTLTAAFQGRSGDEYTTTDGELIVIGNKKQFVQLTQIKSAEPVWVATLSDRMVLITAEFSKSCVSTFEMCGQPLTQFRGGVFQLKGYKFVFRDRNVAQGVTLKQPLENYNSGIPIPEKPLASTLTSGLKIIVDDMEFLGGAGTHVFDKPRAVGNFKELQQLLQQLRTKKSLLPGTRASSSSSRRHPVNMEHDGESSSQPFVTQAHAMTHSSDSEDSCGSVVSQQFDEDDSSLQFATHTHRQPRSKSHKSSLSRKWEQSEPATLGQNTGDIEDVTGSRKRTKAIRDYSDLEFPGATSCAPIRAAQNRDVGKGQFINAPPSSPPAQPQIHNECHCPKKEVLLESQIAKPLLSLHPGWGGMTEVTAQMAKIPLDQQKKLEKSGCWWPDRDAKHTSGYDNIPTVQLVPKNHPPRTRVIPRPSTTLQKHLQPAPKAQSWVPTEQSSDEEAVDWPPSIPLTTPTRQLKKELEIARPSSIAVPLSPYRLTHNTNEIPRQDHQAALEHPVQSQESIIQSSDDEPVPWSPSSPVRSPNSQLQEKLGVEPPSSIVAPSSPQGPDATETTEQSFQPEPELPSRPLSSQEDNPEVGDQSGPAANEHQARDEPKVDDKSEGADGLDVYTNPPLPNSIQGFESFLVEAPLSTRRPATEHDFHHKTFGQSLEDSSVSTNGFQTGNEPAAGDEPEAGGGPGAGGGLEAGDKSTVDSRSTASSEPNDGMDSIDKHKGKISGTRRKRTSSKRVTRAANGIIKALKTNEQLDSQKVRRPKKSRRAFKPAPPRSLSVDDDDDDDGGGGGGGGGGFSSFPCPRAHSEEPPFPVRDPHGATPVDKYGTLVAQQVNEWKKQQQMNKLKKHLEGQYSFNDEDDEDESKCEEAENDATSDESGSEDGAVTEVEEKKLLDKTASSASSAANSAVLTFSAVVLVTGPKRHTQVSDDGDDDIPCAPAVPLKQKGVSPKSSAKKVSELTSNKTQPPSTSPSLAPVVQVKETPYRRVNSLENPLVNSKAQLFGVDDTNAEDMIPATSEQQSSSMENKAKEPERQRASFIQLSSGLNITQESSGRVDGHIEKARKELSDIEVPRTQTEHERNDSAKPLMAPQKQRTKMLKSADFVSQEIRGAQDDISKRIEEEHRKFLSAQAPGGMSLTAKQVSINKEIQLKGEAQHSFSIHGTRPISTSELSSSRKRPPALHPIPITTKKARIHSPHTTSQSATACSLASILATSPGFPSSPPSRPYFCSSKPKPSFTSSPPSRPQLPSSKPALALTSSPLYAPKPHRTIGPLPPSIAQLKPRSRSKPRALPPLKPPPPLKGVQITSINSDSDSESGSNIIEPYKPVSPQEQSLGVLYVSKGNRKATLEGEERKSQQQQSAQPQTDIYAGFRPRSIAVPGYEKLSDNQRRELEERRRKFFGTHREVERFIVTPWTGDRGVAVTAEKRSRWSGGGDLWWMEDDTPMRRFVTRFRGLKAVRRERGDDV